MRRALCTKPMRSAPATRPPMCCELRGILCRAYGQWLSTVVRLGGLIGPGRAPGRFLAGRRELPLGDAPVNLLHLTDAVGVLECILESQAGATRLTYARPITRRGGEFYPAAARLWVWSRPRLLRTAAAAKPSTRRCCAACCRILLSTTICWPRSRTAKPERAAYG